MNGDDAAATRCCCHSQRRMQQQRVSRAMPEVKKKKRYEKKKRNDVFTTRCFFEANVYYNASETPGRVSIDMLYCHLLQLSYTSIIASTFSITAVKNRVFIPFKEKSTINTLAMTKIQRSILAPKRFICSLWLTGTILQPRKEMDANLNIMLRRPWITKVGKDLFEMGVVSDEIAPMRNRGAFVIASCNNSSWTIVDIPGHIGTNSVIDHVNVGGMIETTGCIPFDQWQGRRNIKGANRWGKKKTSSKKQKKCCCRQDEERNGNFLHN